MKKLFALAILLLGHQIIGMDEDFTGWDENLDYVKSHIIPYTFATGSETDSSVSFFFDDSKIDPAVKDDSTASEESSFSSDTESSNISDYYTEADEEVSSTSEEYSYDSTENDPYKKSQLLNSYVCNKCHKSFVTPSKLKRHVDSVHKKKKLHACDMCDKNFTEASDLKVHKRIHTNTQIKPHVCDTCNAAFTKLSHLTRHKEKHVKKEALPCNQCTKSFTRSNSLAQHMKTHVQKGYPCDKCNKICAKPSELLVHQRSHTKEKPFACNVCSKSFATSSTLRSHEKTHTQEKNHVCDICNKAFARSYGLKRHKDLVHNKNPKKRPHEDNEEDDSAEIPLKIQKLEENN